MYPVKPRRLFLILGIILLTASSCGKWAEGYMRTHRGVLAELCTEAFPLDTTLRVDTTYNIDTTLQVDTTYRIDTTHVVCDSAGQQLSQLHIRTTVTKKYHTRTTVYQTSTVKDPADQQLLATARAQRDAALAGQVRLRTGRDGWRLAAVIGGFVVLLLGLWTARKPIAKLFIPAP